jgi:hypothetical protein
VSGQLFNPRKVYPVPPVCTAYWTEADWERTARIVGDPLVLEGLGFRWHADRIENGQTIYRRGESLRSVDPAPAL